VVLSFRQPLSEVIFNPGTDSGVKRKMLLLRAAQGYFDGTRTLFKLKAHEPLFVNHNNTAYRPEKRFAQCRPCSKCQITRFLSFKPRFLKKG
jgi:hypothetical protein